MSDPPKAPDYADRAAAGMLTGDPTDGCDVVPMFPREPRQPGDDGDVIDEYEEPGEHEWLEAEASTAAARKDWPELARVAKELQHRTSVIEPISYIGWADIMAPLPPMDWVVEGLEIAQGAPAMVAGYGFSGKTAALQALLVGLAAGLPIWGDLPCKAGPVCHIDAEQGERLSRDRYQRIARSMGVELADLEAQGDMRLAVFPRQKLCDEIEGTWRRLCEGRRLVVVDSLRALLPPGVDENSSQVRLYVDFFNRLSELEKCAFILVHHARKAQMNSGQPGAIRETIRGSSGLFDAVGTCHVFVAEKGDPPVVHNEKARISGQLQDPFVIEFKDEVDPYAQPPYSKEELRWGLSVRKTDLEGLKVRRAEEKSNKLLELVLAFIRANPDCSDAEIRAGVSGNNADKRAALDKLERTGKAQNLAPSKRGVRAQWRAKV